MKQPTMEVEPSDERGELRGHEEQAVKAAVPPPRSPVLPYCSSKQIQRELRVEVSNRFGELRTLHFTHRVRWAGYRCKLACRIDERARGRGSTVCSSGCRGIAAGRTVSTGVNIRLANKRIVGPAIAWKHIPAQTPGTSWTESSARLICELSPAAFEAELQYAGAV